MAFGEVAQLAVNLSLEGNFTSGISQAEARLGTLNAAATRGVGSTGVLSGAFSRLGSVASGVGGALSHAGNQIKNLVTGPLGLIGLTGGILSIGGAIKSTIDRVNELAFGTEKLTAITGDSAQAESTLIAAADKYGISLDKLTTVAGFYEKTVGKLGETTAKTSAATKSAALLDLERIKNERIAAGESTKAIDALIKRQKAEDALAASTAAATTPLSKLDALQKQFGVTLTDATGKALPFGQALLTVADYYQKSTDKAQAAYLAAQLFGRGYTALVPILALGSAGIVDLEKQAAAMGLQLSESNVADFAKYREAVRGSQEAIAGLEVAIGENLLPTITDLANAVSSFVSTHRQDIVNFVSGIVGAARQAAGVVGTIVGGIQKAWSLIPGPLRDWIVRGVIANQTVKFLFGFDALGAGISAIKNGIIEAMTGGMAKGAVAAGIGKLFVQPVWVTNPGFGGPGGGLPNVIPGAGAAAGAAAEVGGISVGAAVAASALAVGLVALPIAKQLAGGPISPLQQKFKPYVASTPASGNYVAGMDYNDEASFRAGIAAGLMPRSTPDEAAWRAKIAAGITSADQLLGDLPARFRAVVAMPLGDILKGIEARSAARYGHSLGKAAVDATFQRDLLRTAGGIRRSSESNDQKIADLKVLQQDLLSHGTAGDKTTAAKIGGIIAAITKLDLAGKKTDDLISGGKATKHSVDTLVGKAKDDLIVTKIDYAKVDTGARIDRTHAAIVDSQNAIVSTLQWLATQFKLNISVSDISGAQNAQNGLRPPTVVNIGGGSGGGKGGRFNS